MNLKELESYLWGAATYLRGVIDAGDYKQYIFPLLFYKRICDVYDEEYRIALEESDGDLDYAQFAENHRFQIPEKAHWNDVRAVTENVGQVLTKAFRKIERINASQLQGIFGDAEWTNKERITDAMLCNLIEHFSGRNLSIGNVPNDMLGVAYEYLIRKFADDSGHTAAEFYTNRTVVRLMSLIADPQEGESIYDPACGSGGLLLNCAMMLKDAGKEYRTLRLYGQEINLITSAIARMNMLLHGFEEFRIERGDTLKDPRFMHSDTLQQFDIVFANPPYSIKSWDRKSFMNDPFGRNIWGTPPQGCADYAFQQHIIKSLNEKTGRCVILWPHGILFRDAERAMRTKMIESDYIDAIIGLGANLFYNSPMEACLLICRMNKPKERKRKILFINAVDEVRQEKSTSLLEERHILKIFKAYREYRNIPGFARVVENQCIVSQNYTLSIPIYVSRNEAKQDATVSLQSVVRQWDKSAESLQQSLKELVKTLENKK
ncbi:MAG: type I restriction-modification system subunit M [Dysgonamonadaceae bacterium]|jgi:type I restriction enzyme M protein|nr:type I restriction-modification system subunit M [Dysgonamonadaceae bacterium]